MSIYQENFTVKLKNVDNNLILTSTGLLEMLESIAGDHSDSLGFGFNNISINGATWILLNWKVKILKKATYKDKLTIQTWSRKISKCFAYRDFRVLDSNNNIVAIASSKWAYMNINNLRPLRITDEMIDLYQSDPTSVFENAEFARITEPENYSNEFDYTVLRRDIDINNHLHNTYYLSLAMQTLPKEVYEANDLNMFEISYKKEIKLDTNLKILYSLENNNHIISFKDANTDLLYAQIKMSN